jgi:tRNA-dihydrouridine synthase
MIRLTKAVIDSTHLPVTVNRLGWDDNSINIDEVAERLQDVGVAALSIHARTRAQMYRSFGLVTYSTCKNNQNYDAYW